MNKLGKILLGAALLWCAFPVSVSEETALRFVEIFTIPFKIRTYAAVTPGSIEQAAWCRAQLDPNTQSCRRLVRLIASAEPGAFDNSSVRLKLVSQSNGSVLVDMFGGILWEDTGEKRKLIGTGLEEVLAVVGRIAETHACEPQGAWRIHSEP